MSETGRAVCPRTSSSHTDVRSVNRRRGGRVRFGNASGTLDRRSPPPPPPPTSHDDDDGGGGGEALTGGISLRFTVRFLWFQSRYRYSSGFPHRVLYIMLYIIMIYALCGRGGHGVPRQSKRLKGAAVARHGRPNGWPPYCYARRIQGDSFAGRPPFVGAESATRTTVCRAIWAIATSDGRHGRVFSPRIRGRILGGRGEEAIARSHSPDCARINNNCFRNYLSCFPSVFFFFFAIHKINILSIIIDYWQNVFKYWVEF